MEQLVIILIIGAISLVKWLIEKSAEMRERRETEERLDRLDRRVHTPPGPVREAGQEESVRKFLEALGLPVDSPAPPPVPPIVESPVPRAFVSRPVEEPAPRQPPPLVVEEREDAEHRLLEARKLAAEFKKQTAPVHRRSTRSGDTPAVTRFDTLLRSRDGLRQAMLAREILGPPKGLSF